MPRFEIGSIVRVPFPYVDQERTAVRPALIVSRPLGPDGSLVWVAMITSARRSAWPGDLSVGPDHHDYGLPVPCVVRTEKIAAIEIDASYRLLGRLPTTLMTAVQARMAAHMLDPVERLDY